MENNTMICLEPGQGWASLDGEIKIENKGNIRVYMAIYRDVKENENI